MEHLLIYTTAPAVYDGFGTETVEVVGETSDGRELRCVRVQFPHLEWQRRRYLSGNHIALDEAEVFRRVHAKVITAKALIDRMAEAEARDLDAATKNALILMFGCSMLPAFVPSDADSSLAPFVDDNGKINDWGRDVAARIILADPECMPAIKLRARSHIEEQRARVR